MARKWHALGYLNHPTIVEDNVRVDALVDGNTDVEMESLEQDVVGNDYVDSMCDEDLDLKKHKKSMQGKIFSMPMKILMLLPNIFLRIS